MPDCDLCEKYIDPWEANYPLADSPANLRLYRICEECHSALDSILRAHDVHDISGEKTFIEKILETKEDIGDSAKMYLETLLSAAEKATDETTAAEVLDHLLSAPDGVEGLTGSIVKLTSGYNYEGYNIVKYCGFISSETVLGMGVFKGLSAGFSNFFGTESNALGNKLREAKDAAIGRLKEQAAGLEANAIIGVDLDYTMFGDSLVGVIFSGTAVVIEERGVI